MKKLLTILLIMVVMTVSNVCLAASDGIDLDRCQRVVEKFIAVLNTNDDSKFETLTKYLAPELQEQMRMDNFSKIRQDIRGRFGILQELKFVAYERFDQRDRLIYLSSYTRQKLVRLLYGFDKNGKMNEFALVPVVVQE